MPCPVDGTRDCDPICSGCLPLTERVAIVGSREGANLEDVKYFLASLWSKHPDTILVSGGATGVDQIVEQLWLSFGGRVESYRPIGEAWEMLGTKNVCTSYRIEKWELGGDSPMVYPLVDHPTFADYRSACLYRDTLISEVSDRIVGFMRPGGSSGTEFTLGWREESDPKPRYKFFADRDVGDEA